MKLSIKTLILILFFSHATALAYIPSADFIISQLVKNSGSGFYQIKQEVSFPLPSKSISVSETWWIQGPDALFLKAESPFFTQYYLYKNNKRYFFDANGNLKASSRPPYFYENLFFIKRGATLKEELLTKKILNKDVFKVRAPLLSKKELGAASKLNEPYLKMSRLDGSIVYLLGEVTQKENSPGIWVEQERFLLKKIRYPAGVEIHAESFSELSQGLIYPKSQNIQWGGHSVQVELSGGFLLKSPISFFDEKNFEKLQNKNKAPPTESDFQVLTEFYQRFR